MANKTHLGCLRTSRQTSRILPVTKERLVTETVRDTVVYLSQAFKADLRYDPRRYPYESFPFLLEQTFKGYANEDPDLKK